MLNKFLFSKNLKYHKDIVILSMLDLIASLVASIAIFSIIGAMAEDLHLDDISKVAAAGNFNNFN